MDATQQIASDLKHLPEPYLTLPNVARDAKVDTDKLARHLPLIGVAPDAVVQYGDRLIPIFSPAKRDAICVAMSGV